MHGKHLTNIQSMKIVYENTVKKVFSQIHIKIQVFFIIYFIIGKNKNLKSLSVAD
jgi:hypothetical protein